MKKYTFYKNLFKAWAKKIRGDDKSDPMCLPFFEHKILYVPIPKAANTSIKHALCSSMLAEDVSDTQNIHQDPRVPKVAFSDLKNQIDADWFVFTVARNPYERSHSAYRDKVLKERSRIHGVRELGIEPEDEYLTLLRNVRLWPARLLNNHFIPQTLLLERVLNESNLRIFKYEDLNEAWGEIASEVHKKSGVKLADLDIRNATGNSNDRMKPKERDFVRKIYRNDFHVLGYPRT